MRYEWIIGGVALLACALPVKVLWEKLALQRLALGLNLLWAMLVAFHFWGGMYRQVAGLLSTVDGIPLQALAFWVAFFGAALPGWAFVRWGLRDTPADLPLLFERASGIVCTAAVALLMPCLVIVTVSVMPVQVDHILPSEGIPGRCVHVMRRAPVQYYLQSARILGGENTDYLRRERLPGRLRFYLNQGA